MLVIVVTESRIQAVQSNETFTHVQKQWQEKNACTQLHCTILDLNIISSESGHTIYIHFRYPVS